MGLLVFIKPVTYCNHLKGKKPSQVKSHNLRKVMSGGMLELCAANAWDALVVAAKTDGIVLSPSSLGDMYRSISQQKAGFLQRYQTTPIVGASTRTYNGVKYYLKPKNAPLAAPNDDANTCSKHMMGIAVDVKGASGERLKWMEENIEKFGWSWEVLPEEPWHIRYTAGDTVPAAVQEWISTKV